MNKNRQPNFLVVNNETPMTDIEGKYTWTTNVFNFKLWITIKIVDVCYIYNNFPFQTAWKVS